MTPKKVSRPLPEFGCRENWGESHLLLHSSLLLHQRESPNPRFPDQLYVLPFSGFRTIWAKMWFSHSFQFQIWIYQKNYFLNITLPHSILSFFFIAASLSSLRSSSIPIRPPSPRLHRLQPSWCLDKSIAMQTTVQQLSGYQCCALLNGRLRCLDTSRADETFAKLLTARPLPPKSLLDFQRQLFSLSAAFNVLLVWGKTFSLLTVAGILFFTLTMLFQRICSSPCFLASAGRKRIVRGEVCVWELLRFPPDFPTCLGLPVRIKSLP